MPSLAANLTMMYGEHPFLERFAAAARDGFRGVEYLFPYDHPAIELKSRLNAAGLEQALFNAPPGDWAKGERGIASLPDRVDEFRRSIEKALEYARVLGNTRIHVMAGLIGANDDRERHRTAYLNNLAFAAAEAASAGIRIVIEPLHTRDVPGLAPACACAEILGKKPEYLDAHAVSFANAQATTQQIWAPGLDDEYVPQGLAIDGRSVLVAAYRSGDLAVTRGPCRIFRVDVATGRVTGQF